MIDVNIDDYAVMDFLDGLEDLSKNLPLEEIGRLLVESVRENFNQEGRPSWEPRMEPTGGWPLLRKTGDLYNSITFQISGDDVTVDHGTAYGDYLDQGTSRMVARPFLVIQDEDADRIEQIFAQHFS